MQKRIRWQNIAAGGPVAKVDLSSREKAYARYRCWADGEASMREHHTNRTAPELRLDLLTKLRDYRTAGMEDLSNIKRDFGRDIFDPPRVFFRKYHPYFTRHAIESSSLDRDGVEWYNMQTLPNAAATCGAHITSLDISNPRELYSEYTGLPGLVFPSLRVLQLSFSGKNISLLPIALSSSSANVAEHC